MIHLIEKDEEVEYVCPECFLVFTETAEKTLTLDHFEKRCSECVRIYGFYQHSRAQECKLNRHKQRLREVFRCQKITKEGLFSYIDILDSEINDLQQRLETLEIKTRSLDKQIGV